MKTTIGGDRLGSGNKQVVSAKTYERSTHDLSYIWRSSMAAGTLVPFMKELALPGDSWDIDLNAMVLTLPTIGPLFGSYKVQLDVFTCPIRLYNGAIMQNTLGIGMNMALVKLPQIKIKGMNPEQGDDVDNYQVNPSCILSYLDIRGIGIGTNGEINNRQFNAIPLMAYWDIYKNYYANKAEGIGVVIHKPVQIANYNILTILVVPNDGGTWPDFPLSPYVIGGGQQGMLNMTPTARMLLQTSGNFDINDLVVYATLTDALIKPRKVVDIWQTIQSTEAGGITTWWLSMPYAEYLIHIGFYGWINYPQVWGSNTVKPELKTFDLTQIDYMRERARKISVGESNIYENPTAEAPFSFLLEETALPNGRIATAIQSNQEGLAIKTYQSDLFNNWIDTEIMATGGSNINQITAIDTSTGSFNIDTLNLSKKIYDMLNRIAISGGSYDDWIDATYTHERQREITNPVYVGGLSKELIFQEVISTTATEETPLGSLAGRGQLSSKHKGGKINIRVDEPTYIMGIVSLTPRIDYSQGNNWDVNLKTFNDFHKPALDEIGYQDLITDQMVWWDTKIKDDKLTFKSAGKQPAWINYMTNVNRVRGNFAIATQDMFMTLNRKYEVKFNGLNETPKLQDLTTYIDPVKYNSIFADTRLDAQNFWVQISNNITARRKISAKVIPNL